MASHPQVGKPLRIASYNVGVGPSEDCFPNTTSNHQAGQTQDNQQPPHRADSNPRPAVFSQQSSQRALQDWGRKTGRLDTVIQDIQTLCYQNDVVLIQEWGDHVDGCYGHRHDVAG